MAILSDLKTSQARVEYLLKTNPATRDNDRILWLEYIRIFCGGEWFNGAWDSLVSLVMDENVPEQKALARVRAKIQATGLYHGKFQEGKKNLAEEVSKWAKE